MQYLVLIGARARRDIDGLPPEIVRRIDARIRELASNPRPAGCKKLKAHTPEAWRIRIGDYRVLYSVNDAAKQVSILRVGNRSDVY